ncbi:hypothetical protein BJ912DRAFT_605403 [Pholiota molesta]|nr:hypothetical protein BJ912DRAFT_605403 [Pholiota molesta]
MASTANSSVPVAGSVRVSSSRPVTLPKIPELYNPNFLDVLLPGATPAIIVDTKAAASVPAKRNPFMDALKATANHTYTANGAQALRSTLSPALDAFNGLNEYVLPGDIDRLLAASWAEDPQLTLRLIWNVRSIHDGVGAKELFYRAFGWLYVHHPRTAIANLQQLVVPACLARKKGSAAPATLKAHGYWKDLLNILALATRDELTAYRAGFLHAPRDQFTYGRHKGTQITGGTPASRSEANEQASLAAKARAAARRKAQAAEMHIRLVAKLAQPKYRALYIAVAHLFAAQLVKDLRVLAELAALAPGHKDRMALVRKLSLAGKWAPTPGRAHDRVTNISTAIAELIHASQAFDPKSYPSALKTQLSAHERAAVLRSFYQRWVLTELRRAGCYPEPLMSARRWREIKYTRVSSLAMKIHTPTFFKHDPEGFEQYLTAVEANRKTISGAALAPHELVAQAFRLANPYVPDGARRAQAALGDLRRRLAETELRVVEAQWTTLIATLRGAGALENALAVCDVSGSMGSLHPASIKRQRGGGPVPPILPAIALSLVLAALAEAPWNGGFVTFSARPAFVAVDVTAPLAAQARAVSAAEWGMNTNLQAVFLDLLLPLAVRNRVRQEDMVKRLFVFSDMQFDQSLPTARGEFFGGVNAPGAATAWETTYDRIEAAYRAAGYEVPQIVFWDLAAGDKTVEVQGDRKGVAMMNGFSAAMLKVFMGEEEEEEEVMEWENVTEGGESVTVAEKLEQKKAEMEFNPINVMKKVLMRRSYDGLVVLD